MTTPKTAASQSHSGHRREDVVVSPATKEKAESIKAYLENRYSKLKEEEKAKTEAWEQLKKDMEREGLSPAEQEMMKTEILHRQAVLNRESRTKMNIRDFIPVKIIGKGAFGEVRVVKNRKTGEILAMKKMKKSEMIAKHQVQHVKAEKDVLAVANNPWIVSLRYSFQDDKYLYLAMEYLPGGDLMNLLIKKEILSEDDSRFYIAEIISAVESVHKLNYIHRDLKPDNVLINKNGHIKLSDFGLCKYAQIKPSSSKPEVARKEEEPRLTMSQISKLSESEKRRLYNKDRRHLAFSTVGTPDYIAPEVFGQGGYNETVDWWSVGVIFFEMVVGYPPFFSDDPSVTCQKIIHWKKTLLIPSDANLSPAATNLIRNLVCDADKRLGSKGVQDIKSHPFFHGLDWEHLHDIKAPFIPDLASEIDTTQFDHFDEDKNEPFYPPEEVKVKKTVDPYFIGYTFKEDLEKKKNLLFQQVSSQGVGSVPSEEEKSEVDGAESRHQHEEMKRSYGKEFSPSESKGSAKGSISKNNPIPLLKSGISIQKKPLAGAPPTRLPVAQINIQKPQGAKAFSVRKPEDSDAKRSTTPVKH